MDKIADWYEMYIIYLKNSEWREKNELSDFFVDKKMYKSSKKWKRHREIVRFSILLLLPVAVAVAAALELYN